MDDSANRVSTQIVEPEKDASMSELIKYNEQLNKYMWRVKVENSLLPCGDSKLVPRYLTLFFIRQNNQI